MLEEKLMDNDEIAKEASEVVKEATENKENTETKEASETKIEAEEN